MAKDWKGNKNSVYKTLAASNHVSDNREKYDFYATEPKAVDLLLKLEKFNQNVWECACGQGHLSKQLEASGYKVRSSDIFDRGFGEPGVDFLGIDNVEWDGDIITNPPYIYAHEFVLKGLNIIPTGKRIALFLKLQFLESKGRKTLFLHFPPSIIYISCSRLICAKNGEFDKIDSSAVAYAWFIWEKGYKGDTILKWFN